MSTPLTFADARQLPPGTVLEVVDTRCRCSEHCPFQLSVVYLGARVQYTGRYVIVGPGERLEVRALDPVRYPELGADGSRTFAPSMFRVVGPGAPEGHAGDLYRAFLGT